MNNEQCLGAVLWELYETKERNRELLRMNTDLRIENAALRVKVEMLECFQGREGRK